MKKILFLMIALALATSSHAAWDTTYFPGELKTNRLQVTEGIVDIPEVFFDIATASSFTYVAGNSVLGTVSTTTLVAAGTSYSLAVGDYSNSAYPRNVVAAIAVGAGSSTTTIAGTLVITGTDARGNAIVESLSVSTTTATGNYAYSSITAMALSVTSLSPTTSASAYVSIGTGVKIGLANNLDAAGDIRKVNEAGTATTTYTANTTYNTITFVNAPDGSKDYKVTYKVKTR